MAVQAFSEVIKNNNNNDKFVFRKQEKIWN